MKYINLLILLIILPFCSYSAPYTNLGVNLVNDGAFVNIINQTNRFQNATSYDDNGWPESDFELVLMDGRPVAEWNNDIDDPELYRRDNSGIYKCSFTGSANLSVWGSGTSIKNLTWDEQNNITFFDLDVPGPPGDNHGIVVLTFTNTARSVEGATNRGITNLKVMRPGYDLDTKQTFTDEYISLCKAANFACYRYYNIQNIWDGEPVYPIKTGWEMRKTPNDLCQITMKNLNGKIDGWCWEYIIELSNLLKKDIWICIHISCDSTYVTNLAKMLKDSLDSSINIYIENSNEVWSPTQAAFGPYNKAQADAFGISFDENYARRSVELSNWFSNVFGKDEINRRIRVILSGQHSYVGRHNPHLNYINDNFGNPKNYIYALSTALYFGSTKSGGTVEEINEGIAEDINNQINDNQSSTYRKAHIEKASEWELPGGCTSYEGGPGIPAGGGKNNLGNQILANRTKEMADIMKKNFAEGWFDIGGGLALQFTLASGYNRYGCWGLTDDYTNPDRNYKMQAVRDLIGGWNETEIFDLNSGLAKLTIYPNPVSNIINISLTEFEFEIISLKIYDLYGRELKTLYNGIATGKLKLAFDLNGLTTGMYFIVLNTSKQRNTISFVVL